MGEEIWIKHHTTMLNNTNSHKSYLKLFYNIFDAFWMLKFIHYLRDNYYQSTMRYSIVDSQVKKISSIDNMQEIRKEIRKVLTNYEFKSVLEVGVGELTTIEDIYKFFGPDIDCYGVDLSLNRIKHGLEEYKKRHDQSNF